MDFLSAPDIARLRLAADPDLSPWKAARELLNVFQQEPSIYLPLWSYTLLSVLHSAISNLDSTTFPVCAITGSPGFGKTTLVRRFALLFEDIDIPDQPLGELDAASHMPIYGRHSLRPETEFCFWMT